MVAWSSALSLVGRNIAKTSVILPKNVVCKVPVRVMSGHGPRLFPLQPSRWQWHKTKDLFHYYVLVGAIPALIVVFLTNVFVGPATLEEIPEGYVPKHWEYYRHPIQRFFSRYVHAPAQQDYEKYLHVLHEEAEVIKIRQLEKKVESLMSKRGDYKSYYYRPVTAKYQRLTKEVNEELESLRGN